MLLDIKFENYCKSKGYLPCYICEGATSYDITSMLVGYIQSNLSYVMIFQGNIEIWSHKTGDC